jgi:hypothetical protein
MIDDARLLERPPTCAACGHLSAWPVEWLVPSAALIYRDIARDRLRRILARQ